MQNHPEQDEVFLKSGSVRERYDNASGSWLHRQVKNPASGFPRPIYINGVRYWRLSELLEFERKCATLNSATARRLSARDGMRRDVRYFQAEEIAGVSVRWALNKTPAMLPTAQGNGQRPYYHEAGGSNIEHTATAKTARSGGRDTGTNPSAGATR